MFHHDAWELLFFVRTEILFSFSRLQPTSAFVSASNQNKHVESTCGGCLRLCIPVSRPITDSGRLVPLISLHPYLHRRKADAQVARML
jgi:hypothetical protein